MLGEVTARLRDARSAIVGWGLCLAAAALGLVWLSIAAVQFLAAWLDPRAAAALIGVICLLPVTIAALRANVHKTERPAPQPVQPGLYGADPALHYAGIAKAAEKLVDRSPLTALAVAALAGLLAARFPAALGLLLQILQQTQPDSTD